jgi:hypothetical protein
LAINRAFTFFAMLWCGLCTRRSACGWWGAYPGRWFRCTRHATTSERAKNK